MMPQPSTALKQRGSIVREKGGDKTLLDHHGKERSKHQRTRGTKSALSEWSFFMCFLAILALIAYNGQSRLPTPVVESRNPSTGQSQISEHNMRQVVKRLAGDIGLRVVGTKGGYEAQEYIVKQIKEWRRDAEIEAARGAQDLPKFDLWEQTEDGSHRFDFMSKIMMKTYVNMTNVIVRLSCGPECDQNAILLNAHFDSTFGSPGATDDGLGVAVMMDLIRVLSLRPAPKKNSIIFLFNGGEESFQDASHAFIKYHELKNTIKTVVNLEATGTSGPEVLFQANSLEMVEAYRKVPYPHGTVIGNDLFATGVLLGDTDFRQFVHYGNLTGVDMAWYKNSYLYHTRLDLEENIEVGAPQHTGENVLALIEYLANEVELNKFETTSKIVFFDVLGRFFVSYTMATAAKIYTLVGALAAVAVATEASRPTPFSLLSVLISALSAVVVPVPAAKFIFSIGRSMIWFSHEWFPVMFFGPLSVVAMFSVQYIFHDKRASTEANELSTLSGLHLLFTGLMAIAAYYNIGAAYLLAMFSASLSVSLIFNKIMGNIRGADKVVTVEYLTYIIAATVPGLFAFTISFVLIDLITPLLGRTGVFSPVDTVAAVATGLLVFLTLPITLGLTHRFGRAFLQKMILGLFMCGSALFALGLGVLVPYDRMHPKRIYAQHLRNMTSGETRLYLAHADSGPLYDPFVKNLEAIFGSKAEFKTAIENQDEFNTAFPINQFLDSYALDTTPYLKAQTSNATISGTSGSLTDFIQDAPKLVTEKASYDPDTGIRKISIICTHPQYVLTVAAFTAHVTKWSLDPDPLDKPFYYAVRNASGYLTDGWRMDLEYRATGPDDKLKIELTAVETESFDQEIERPLTGAARGDIGVMRALIQATPDFINLTRFNVVLTVFEL